MDVDAFGNQTPTTENKKTPMNENRGKWVRYMAIVQSKFQVALKAWPATYWIVQQIMIESSIMPATGILHSILYSFGKWSGAGVGVGMLRGNA